MTRNLEHDRQLAKWLLICATLVFAMVILGGVTRLTGSGLSMVKWHPIHGVVPPLNEQEWIEEFDHYKQSPEFQKKNWHFELHQFKSIFYFEYGHRMLGRLIGLVFLLPFLYFWIRGRIRPELIPKFILMFILGGMQGVLGWYMVKSGLVDNPNVSQYRLTAHLVAAILIYGFIVWTALDLLREETKKSLALSSCPGVRRMAWLLTVLVIVTIISGGFVAGLKAGLIFNSFPTMHGQWIPEGLWALQPWYLNFFENMVTVQFDHRVLAMTTAVLLIVYVLNSKRYHCDKKTTSSFNIIALVVIVQIILGISTLLLHVPVWLGALHQGGALLLFTAMLYHQHRLSRL